MDSNHLQKVIHKLETQLANINNKILSEFPIFKNILPISKITRKLGRINILVLK